MQSLCVCCAGLDDVGADSSDAREAAPGDELGSDSESDPDPGAGPDAASASLAASAPGTSANEPSPPVLSTEEVNSEDAALPIDLPDTASPDYGGCTLDGTFEVGTNYATPWDTPCDDQACADAPAAASVLSLVEGELERLGVGEYYRFIRASSVGTTEVELAVVVTFGWFQAARLELFPLELDADSVQDHVRAHFCLDLPREIASFADTLAAIHSCDPEIEYTGCSNLLNNCTALATGSTDAPWVETSPGCYQSDYSYASVFVQTGTRHSCSLSTTACQ